MDLLENLIGTIANPRSRKGGQLKFEPVEAPDFKEYFTSLESIIGKYEELILRKLDSSGIGFLHTIIADLDTTDSIRCFFAILFLARDQKVDLEQVEDDIKITLLENTP
jgi:segregation and condensation protein A